MTTSTETCGFNLGIESCHNKRVAAGWLCAEHGCGVCGHVMLADTEEWPVHVCDGCLQVDLIDITEWLDGLIAQSHQDSARYMALWAVAQGLKSGDFRKAK